MIPDVSTMYIDFIRIVLGVVLFGLAAYHDINGRHIPDYIWNVLVVGGGVLFSIHILSSVTPFELISRYVANIGLAIAIGWGMYLSGLFGGADAKAITAIAVLFPVHPHLGMVSLAGASYSIPVYTPVIAPPFDYVLPLVILTFLANTAIFGVVYPASLILRSLKRGVDRSQPFNSVLGDQVAIKDLLDYHGIVVDASVYGSIDEMSALQQYRQSTSNGLHLEFIRDYVGWYQDKYDKDATIEDVDWKISEFVSDYNEQADENYQMQFEGNPFADSVSDVEDILSRLQNQQHVLVTPGFPFIVPMFFGVLSMVTIGDLVFAAIIYL